MWPQKTSACFRLSRIPSKAPENNDCVGRRLSDCTNGPGHTRLPVLEPGQSLSQRVVCPTFCLALGHETTLLQQLRPVLLQKPLDRSRTRLMWSNVDVADAFSHALNSRALYRTNTREITFADRPDKASAT